jgi:hypothetical protein
LSAVSTAGAGNNAASYTLTVNPMIEGQAYRLYTTTVLATQIQGVAANYKITGCITGRQVCDQHGSINL